MKDKKMMKVRRLEEKLKSASPTEAGKLTKKLVRLKDDWVNK